MTDRCRQCDGFWCMSRLAGSRDEICHYCEIKNLRAVVKSVTDNANDPGQDCGYYRVPRRYIEQLRRVLAESENLHGRT